MFEKQNLIDSWAILPDFLMRIKSRVLGSAFLKANLLVFIIVNMGNIFSYLFQFAMGHLLTSHDYGTMNALLSFACIISAPFAVIPIVMANFTANYASCNKIKHIAYITKRSFKFMAIFGFIVFIAGCLLMGKIGGYLKIAAAVPILIIIVQSATGLISPVFIGVLQGLKRFTFYSLSIASFASLRFFIGLLLVGVIGMKLNGALLAGLIAGLFPLFLSFIFLRDVIFIKTNPVPQNSSKIFKEMLIYAIPVFLTYIGVTFLTNMDMIMVKHYFTAAETGTYSAAVVIGRIAYFLPATIVAVLFPVVSAEHARGENTHKFLWVSLFLTFLISGSVAVVFYMFPGFIVKILFGAKYLPAQSLLKITVFSMMFLSLITVVANYSLAKRKWLFLVPLLIGVVLEPVIIYLFHLSLKRVALSVMILMAVVFAIIVFIEGIKVKRR